MMPFKKRPIHNPYLSLSLLACCCYRWPPRCFVVLRCYTFSLLGAFPCQCTYSFPLSFFFPLRFPFVHGRLGFLDTVDHGCSMCYLSPLVVMVFLFVCCSVALRLPRRSWHRFVAVISFQRSRLLFDPDIAFISQCASYIAQAWLPLPCPYLLAVPTNPLHVPWPWRPPPPSSRILVDPPPSHPLPPQSDLDLVFHLDGHSYQDLAAVRDVLLGHLADTFPSVLGPHARRGVSRQDVHHTAVQ